MKKVTIIVPVYGDWSSLKENIKALMKNVPRSFPHEVILANDCGPEVDELEHKILKLIRKHENFKYHRNDQNLGFVQNCNNAVFNLSDGESDVLLLNSDAVATRGFLEALQDTLYAQPDIGAVSARSNAATIFSVPMKPAPGKQYSMRQSYRVYKKIRDEIPPYYISPIAHGFCMMIRREVIDRYGLFDEVYGKGYGEENDFCMRIRREGWKCAIANKAFVFHYKARSFSEERRSAQVAKNEKILDERYPEYRQLIRDYVEEINEPSV